VIAVSPTAGLGADSVQLTTNNATTDAVGIARPILQPLSDLTGGSWQTLINGDSGQIGSEPAALKFAIFRNGVSQFTTMVVERVYNATLTPDVWQTTTLTNSTVVWQTSGSDAFCNVFPFCTFAEFKAQYPNANITGLTVGIGTGIPPTTSFVDGVSLTIDGTTDTWDFELAAPPPSSAPPSSAPPSAPPSSAPSSSVSPSSSVPPPSPAATAPPAAITAPPTDGDPTAQSQPVDSRWAFLVLGGIVLLAVLSVRLRPSR
jgi:hypothetical protein